MYMTNAKALVAAIWGAVTGVISSLTVVLVGDATLQSLTQGQWLAVIASAVAGFGGGYGLTWSVTNKPGEVTDAQAAAVLDKYTVPVQSGGQGNGDIASQ
jgi:hypothetical protein